MNPLHERVPVRRAAVAAVPKVKSIVYQLYRSENAHRPRTRFPNSLRTGEIKRIIPFRSPIRWTARSQNNSKRPTPIGSIPYNIVVYGTFVHLVWVKSILIRNITQHICNSVRSELQLNYVFSVCSIKILNLTRRITELPWTRSFCVQIYDGTDFRVPITTSCFRHRVCRVRYPFSLDLC